MSPASLPGCKETLHFEWERGEEGGTLVVSSFYSVHWLHRAKLTEDTFVKILQLVALLSFLV